MAPLLRRAAWLLVAFLLVSPLSACGPSPTEPGGLEGQVLGMLSPTEQPIMLQGALIAISGPSGSQVAQTDGSGAYRFDALPPGRYGFAASYQGSQAGDKRLQAEERQFSISAGQDETISVVLLAEGITPPPTPPPPPPQGTASAQAASAGGVGSSLMGNPFFWYFLFNQPFSYGFGRPPVILSPGGGGPIIINQEQPQRSPSGRPYTNYGDAGAAGVRTKPMPEVTSKGATRPGASGNTGGSGGAVRPPSAGSTPAVRSPSSSNGNAPAAKAPAQSNPSSDSGSKGVTRPGSSAPSVKPPSAKPPSVRPPSGGKRR